MATNQTQVWMVWFHPRDRKATPGYGRAMEGDRATIKAQAAKIAGRTYTFTMKQTTAHKPYTPKRKHSRP